RGRRGLQRVIDADDLAAIHRDALRLLLVELHPDGRLAGHHQAERRAVRSVAPRSVVIHDLAVLVSVDVFTEVIHVAGLRIDGEKVARYFDDLSFSVPLALFDD